MWKFLLLGAAFAADTLARVGLSIGTRPCICGQPCFMNGGGSGVCQVNGECAVNIVAPNCGGVELAARLPLVSGTVTPKLPCPVVICIPPPCPQSQQEVATDANGCKLCPVCKGITGVPAVFANIAARATLNPDFDLTAVVCPQLACLPLTCPAALQVPTTASNGCPGCPKCRDLVAVEGVLSDSCAVVLCGPGFVCRNGICIADTISLPYDRCSTIRCARGFICRNGRCIADIITQPLNPCALILCAPGHRCEDGQCVANDSSCAAVLCASGQRCVNGICMANTLTLGGF